MNDDKISWYNDIKFDDDDDEDGNDGNDNDFVYT